MGIKSDQVQGRISIFDVKGKKVELKFTSRWYRQIDRVRIGSETIESLINQIAEVPELMLFHFLIQFDLNFQNLHRSIANQYMKFCAIFDLKKQFGKQRS